MMPLSASTKKKYLYVAAAVLPAAVAAFFAFSSGDAGLRRLFLKFLDAVEHSGPFGPLVFLALFNGACVFLLPTFYLTIGAGVLFGLRAGFLIATLSVASGASAAFLFARYMVRRRILEAWGSNTSFLALDEAVAEDGWKIVFLSRLSPAFPFNVLNYAFGLTAIPFSVYFAASWAGSIPWTFMYVYFGSLAAEIAGLHPEMAQGSKLQWALSFLGLAATAAAAITASRTAGAALKKRLRLEEEKEEGRRGSASRQ
ncbi:TVP38/TMEM64 family protein [Aminivibrio sp.]|uniref:TVP38/TMEM64 family protein n=1 Tax=Aminivibrio sp. TaxID=1872489 RepID=UPI001A472F05|nr:TVP38/TMEM64 family protein [Aminivibrio sp.]MBL3539990.1 TVP38/TMEM64 family protein [Aminivibrio sp.]